MASKTPTPLNKEDELGRKWDRCLTDLILKLGGGLIIGGVVSYIFCNRRKWPMALASGFAVGMAYCNCERDLNLAVSASCDPTPKDQAGGSASISTSSPLLGTNLDRNAGVKSH